jgi:hypothetical protein
LSISPGPLDGGSSGCGVVEVNGDSVLIKVFSVFVVVLVVLNEFSLGFCVIVFVSFIFASGVGFKSPGVSGRTAVVINEEATDATMNEAVAIPPNINGFI